MSYKFKVSGIILASLLLISLSGSAIAEKSITLKLGDESPPGSFKAQAYGRFAQLVEEKTNGEIKIDYFPAEQLGPSEQQIEYVAIGAQELTGGGTTYWGVYDKRCYLAESPFVFESREHFEHWVDEIFYPKVVPNILKKGNQRILKGDVLWRRGPFRIMAARRPIFTPEDLKGLKLRLWPDPVVHTQYKVLGCKPTHLDWNETYTGLATGVVDAVTGPLSLLWPMKFTEQVKYVIELKTFPQQVIVSINEDTWQRLSPSQQKKLVEALDEAGRWFNEQVYAEAEGTIEKVVNEHNAFYIKLNRAPFAKICREKGFPLLVEKGLVKEEYLEEVKEVLLKYK